MNPFLHDTVASPLSIRPKGSWRFPFSPQRQCARLSRQASVLALAAGVGAVAGVSIDAQAIDVNTASQSQLQAVRGVGPRTAQIIVQERARAGHFESLEDLSDRVRGIGVKKLQAMQAGGLRAGSRSPDALQDSATAGAGSKQSGRAHTGVSSRETSGMYSVATPALIEISEAIGTKP